MGIGSIKAAESMPVSQMTRTQSTDFVSKGIENKISDVQRRMQALSSKEDLSAEEKRKKRQELSQELNGLNTQLRQQKTESQKEAQKETPADRLKAENAAKDAKNAKAAKEAKALEDRKSREKADAKKHEAQKAAAAKKDNGTKNADAAKKTDAAKPAAEASAGKSEKAVEAIRDAAADRAQEKELSPTGMKALVSADTSVKRAAQQGSVVSRIDGGIAILKGEIRQDQSRGVDVESKKDEVARLREQSKTAASTQLTILDEARKTMLEAAQSASQDDSRSGVTMEQAPDQDKIIVRATNYAMEPDTAFQVHISQ